MVSAELEIERSASLGGSARKRGPERGVRETRERNREGHGTDDVRCATAMISIYTDRLCVMIDVCDETT